MKYIKRNLNYVWKNISEDYIIVTFKSCNNLNNNLIYILQYYAL